MSSPAVSSFRNRSSTRRRSNTRSIDAQIRSSQAQVTQAEASLNQNQVNLDHTVIRAPIDGLVISRNVDVGQTVAASMQAPTLFILAADLTKMQVVANLDESDVGRIRPGQQVHVPRRRLPDRGFRRHRGAGAPPADRPAERRHLRDRHRRAEPGAEAEARDDGQRQRRDRQAHRHHHAFRTPLCVSVRRPRYSPLSSLHCRRLASPGWSGEGRDEADRVLRVHEVHKVLRVHRVLEVAQGAQVLKRLLRRAPSARSGEGGGEAAPIAPRAPGAPGQQANLVHLVLAVADSGGGDPARMAERMQNMTPEQREQMLARMRGRGGDGGRNSAAAGAARVRRSGRWTVRRARGNATTIDALFGPLPTDRIARPGLGLGRQAAQAGAPASRDHRRTDDRTARRRRRSPGSTLVTNISTGTETVRAPAGFGFPPFMGPGGPGGRRRPAAATAAAAAAAAAIAAAADGSGTRDLQVGL